MEGGKCLEVLAHLLLGEIFHHWEEGGIVDRLGGEGHGCLGEDRA